MAEARLAVAHKNPHYLGIQERCTLADAAFAAQSSRVTPYVRLYSGRFAESEREKKDMVGDNRGNHQSVRDVINALIVGNLVDVSCATFMLCTSPRESLASSLRAKGGRFGGRNLAAPKSAGKGGAGKHEGFADDDGIRHSSCGTVRQWRKIGGRVETGKMRHVEWRSFGVSTATWRDRRNYAPWRKSRRATSRRLQRVSRWRFVVRFI